LYYTGNGTKNTNKTAWSSNSKLTTVTLQANTQYYFYYNIEKGYLDNPTITIEYSDTQEFSLSKNGKLICTNAKIHGHIEAESGTFQGTL
jgi:hypothetical protein